MTPKRKSLLRVGILCLLLCMCFGFAACQEQETPKPTSGEPAQQMTYNLELKTQGGTGIGDITVYIYADDTLADLVAFAKTDKDGKASFTYDEGQYVAVLVDVPEGYIVEKSYPITGENTLITLETELVQGDLETDTYKLGDVMKDFTFTAADGTEYKLSELLQEKKAVVLNFWFVNCNPCRMEFPYLQEAYTEYADVIEVLAMNPVDSDNAKITAFAQELGLTFPIGACENTWEKAMQIQGYPTTVVIDRFGAIGFMHSATIPDAQIFKDLFAYFTAEDYTQSVVENLDEISTAEPEIGTYTNPVEINGVPSFQLTIEPGQVQYVNVHKMQNVWMQANADNIYVEYSGKTHTASGGSLGLMISAPSTFQPASLIFGNTGSESVTFTVTLSNLAGSYENPYTMSLGEFTTKISSGNNQGVYFTYTASEDGHFSLKCLAVSPVVAYDISIMNLATSAMRNLSSDGQPDTDGINMITVPMNAGEKLRITVSTLPDDANNYPGASFKMQAKFAAGDVEDVVVKEKIAYAVTVTDETRKPISGVNIALTGTEGNKISLVTDENGVVSGWFNEDVYTGVMVLPKGYKATTTNFELTPEMPMVSLKLDTVVIEYADYLVRVIDEEGNGVPGVLITIGTTYGTTDENGVYTVNLVKGNYTAVIGVPEGYASDAMSYPFPENSTVLGITLREDTSGEQTGIPYTVQVVDGAGLAMADVLVTFNRDGNPVTMAPTDATGTATVTLPAGDYKVSLTSASGAVLGHLDSEAILSAEKTATVITVAANIGGDNYDNAYWGNYYRLTVGSSKIDLEDTVNFVMDYEAWMYVFYPGSSGIYRFTISEGAVLGYYGGISFPNGPSKSTETDGYFEIVIRDGEFANGNMPSFVLGAKSTDGKGYATMTITRVADAPAELPVVTYEPKATLSPFKMTQSGTLTYVDLTNKATITKRSDGYYMNNKKLYINLSYNAPYITFSNMMGLNYIGGEWAEASTGTGLKGLIYDGDNVVGIEDFTQCMRDYICVSDPVSGLYPLTEDLMYMIQSAGAYMGWWNAESPNYLFASVEGLNTDTAWMFACCYVN